MSADTANCRCWPVSAALMTHRIAPTPPSVPMQVPAELVPAVHALVAQFAVTRGQAPPAYPAAPLALQYQPAARPRWRWWHAWPLAATMALFLVPVCTISAFVVGRFETLFRDMKLDLPGITKLLIGFTRWITASFGWAALLGIAMVLPTLLAAIFRPTPDELRRCVRVLVAALTVIGAAFALFAVPALTSPAITLHQFITGGAAAH
jgi:hypothetical protein